jgi:hypothetical protein
MTATYNPTSNTISEVAQLAEPLHYQAWLACVENDKVLVMTEGYANEIKEYHNHVSKLRTISCDEKCRELWRGRDKVVENVDYKLAIAYEIDGSGLGEYVAVPILPQGEDLWAKFWGRVNELTGFDMNIRVMSRAQLKNEFTVTKIDKTIL